MIIDFVSLFFRPEKPFRFYEGP